MGVADFPKRMLSCVLFRGESALHKLPSSKFKDQAFRLFRVKVNPDAQERFVLEDSSGEPIVVEWQQSKLPLANVVVTSQDLSVNGSVFEIIQPTIRMSDLVLEENIRRDTVRILQEARDWEFLRSHGLSPASCVLFCGPGGSGKTSAAEAIAAELGLKLVRFSFKKISSILAEENRAMMQSIVAFLDTGRWVVLVDDVVPSSDDITEEGLRNFRSSISALLPMFDKILGRSLVIVSSTSEQVLDDSFWQRFDEVVRFHAPGRKEIRGALAKWLDPLVCAECQLDKLLDIADELSFSSVERLCLDVKRSCVLRGENIVLDSDITGASQRQQSRTRSFNFSTMRLPHLYDRSASFSATVD